LPSSAENSHTHIQHELQDIDEEISSLERELESMRKKALNEEMHAQPYMIDNWHEFAEDIQRAEANEKGILATKKKIQALKDLKEALLKQAPLK
jgi:hypothetical protein